MNAEKRQVLTNSSLTTFKICPRRYEFRYEQGYVPAEERKALYFGKLFHAGLEAWGNAEPGAALADAIEAVEIMVNAAEEPDEYAKVTAIALLEGYDLRYKNDEYEVVECEKEFRAPLLNPDTAAESRLFILGGVIDKILKKDGRHFIQETKTTSDDISPESDYWRRLLIDSQISTYYIGAEANGIKIESCIYDVIRKPSIRPGKATPQENRKYTKDGRLYAAQREVDETPMEFFARLKQDVLERPDFYYARKEVPRSENDLAEFYMDAWHTSQSMRAFQLNGRFPRFTNSCMTYYGKCPYFNVCTGMTTLDDPDQFKKIENAHQELKSLSNGHKAEKQKEAV